MTTTNKNHRLFKDYTEAASIHGCSYLCEDKRYLVERVLWILLMLLAIAVSLSFMYPMYERWENSPVYTTVGSTDYYVGKIDFPAVTICPNNRINMFLLKKALQFSPWAYHPEAGSPDFEDDMANIVHNLIFFAQEDHVLNFTDNQLMMLEMERDYMPQLLRNAMYKCSTMIQYCEWEGRKVNCNELFQVRPTDGGFCCSFNTISQSDQFIPPDEKLEETEGGEDMPQYDGGSALFTTTRRSPRTTKSFFEDITEATTGPLFEAPVETTQSPPTSSKEDTIRRTQSANANKGLKVILKSDGDRYSQFAVNDYVGFRVLIHNPYDYADVTARGFAINAGNVAYVGVEADVTRSSKQVRKMKMKRRQCVRRSDPIKKMQEELGAILQVFKTYSRSSCLLECQARWLYDRCGCLPYFYPNFAYAWQKPTSCGFPGLLCLQFEMAMLNSAGITDDEDDDDEEDDERSGAKTTSNTDGFEGPKCLCPKDCDHTSYRAEVTQVKLREIHSNLMTKMTQEGGVFYEMQKELDSIRKANRSTSRINRAEAKMNRMVNNFLEDSSFLNVHFKSLGVTKFTREELYDTPSLIGGFGGIIGLFMGLSMLSLAEIVYWFTIRPCANLYRNRKVTHPSNYHNSHNR